MFDLPAGQPSRENLLMGPDIVFAPTCWYATDAGKMGLRWNRDGEAALLDSMCVFSVCCTHQRPTQKLTDIDTPIVVRRELSRMSAFWPCPTSQGHRSPPRGRVKRYQNRMQLAWAVRAFAPHLQVASAGSSTQMSRFCWLPLTCECCRMRARSTVVDMICGKLGRPNRANEISVFRTSLPPSYPHPAAPACLFSPLLERHGHAMSCVQCSAASPVPSPRVSVA